MFENWTDEEVKNFGLTGVVPQGKSFSTQAFKKPAATPAMAPEEPVDNTQGMGSGELALAGAGAWGTELVEGAKDLGRIAFRPKGPQGDQMLAQVNAKRAERDKHIRALMLNPEAQAGSLGMDMAASLAAPAAIIPQSMLQGTLAATRAPHSPANSLPGELMNRVASGIAGAGTTAAIGVPLAGAGRLMGAASGKFSPSGAKAMELNAGAKRLGVNPTIRDLDPSSEIAGFEGSLTGRARVVENQADAYRTAARDTVDVPSASGKSYEVKTLEGEKVRRAVVDSVENLKQRGSDLWDDLDGYIGQNQIPPVTPQLSYQQSDHILRKYTPMKKGNYVFEDNPIFSRVAFYDEKAAQDLIAMSRAPKAAVQYGAPFSDLHKLQAAVGKALGRARRDAGMPGAGEEARKAATELSKLYGTISQDVDNWMTKVAVSSGDDTLRTKAEMARGFWRDRVVPGVQGNLPQKARKGTWRQDPRGYKEPTEMYTDLVKAKSQVDELLPFMSREQQDLINTIMGMPDLQTVMKSGVPHPASSGMGMLTNIGGMLIGSPLQLAKGALSHAPVIRQGMNTDAMKRLYFAENVLNRTPAGSLAWAGAQYPQNEAEDWTQRLLGRD